MSRIQFDKTQKAPYQPKQVLVKAKIISTSLRGDDWKNDVIDINGNREADGLSYRSGGDLRKKIFEPIIHSGTDANGRQVGLSTLKEKARETGQRYFTADDLGGWAVYHTTLTGGAGQSMSDWRGLGDVAKELCPEYNYRQGPNFAIDLKRMEFVVFDSAR